jgi:hypothetical protein
VYQGKGQIVLLGELPVPPVPLQGVRADPFNLGIWGLKLLVVVAEGAGFVGTRRVLPSLGQEQWMMSLSPRTL